MAKRSRKTDNTVAKLLMDAKQALLQDPDRDTALITAQQDATRFKRAYHNIVREQVEEERLIKMFGRSIKAFPGLPASAYVRPPVKPRKSTDKLIEVPMLIRSDQQIGEEVKHEETFGINSYNFLMYQRRLAHLEERVLDLLMTHQAHRSIDTIVVPYLGDNMSGLIHEELQKFGHQHIIDQVYLGALCESLFLWRLRKLGKFKRIIVPCVSGNHGRISEKKETKRYYKNFDYLFHSIMALALRKVPDIEFVIPKCLFMVQEVAGRLILLSHGHELPPSSLGIPLYSINRASANYQELLSIKDGSRFDYWIMGHFHRPMELDNSIVNGTMAGLTEMGIGRWKPTRPMQRLIGFTNRWGKSFEYPVWLEQAPDTPSAYTFDPEMATDDALDHFEWMTK